MLQSVLGSVTLGYRTLWGRTRSLAGIQLLVQPEPGAAIDAPHLVQTLQEQWSADSPQLLLSPQDRGLLNQLLRSATADGPWIDVRGAWLDNAQAAVAVQQAQRRGARLLWRGSAHLRPPEVLRGMFARSIFVLPPELAATALRAASMRSPLPGARALVTPVLQGQVYEGVESRLLMQHCLDHQDAWGLLGWPDEDVLHPFRNDAVPPARPAVVGLLQAIDADVSTDTLDQLLAEEPVLAYRFLLYVNSAAWGRARGIESIRHGLMMLGYTRLQQWLGQQLPGASDDLDLQPVKAQMVLRGRLVEHLLDAGIEEDLRREVYLTGMLASMDALLHEPIGVTLHRLPLSERVYDAVVAQQGPYTDSLQLARAMGEADLATVRKLRHDAERDAEDVNRALLRTLGSFHFGRSPQALPAR